MSKSRPARCLRLVKTDGPTPTYTWETDGPWHTAFSMLNSGVFPSAEQESFLSRILQANVPETYCLSQKACLGILRRASRRGKELPAILRLALERQAGLLSA